MNIRCETITRLDVALGKLDHGISELVVDFLMDIDSLGQHANLARVQKGQRSKLGHALGDVHILANNGGIVSAQLERVPLERLCAARGDALSRGDGTGEGNEVNVRVLRHPGAEVVVAAEDLEDARREHGHGQLADLEVAVGRVRRGLHDEHVAREEGGGDLGGAQKHGPVPRHDGAADAHGRIRLVDGLFVVLVENLLVELEVGEPAQPPQRVVELRLRQADGLALLHGEELLEGLAVLLDGVGELEHECPPRVRRRLGP